MPLVAIVGTGTGVGKTHTTCALARALGARGTKVLAYKPVESGVLGSGASPGRDPQLLGSDPVFAEDIEALRAASNVAGETLEDYLAPLLLPIPISPHLAARKANATLDRAALVRFLQKARAEVFVLLELPGGLFSPLADEGDGAWLPGDLLAAVRPDLTLLVAPDRLGVLHDLGATTRAARLDGIALDGIVFSAPETLDASTGTNVGEVPRVTPLPVFATLPRLSVAELAQHPALFGLVDRVSAIS